jgi:hypothetical protein
VRLVQARVTPRHARRRMSQQRADRRFVMPRQGQSRAVAASEIMPRRPLNPGPLHRRYPDAFVKITGINRTCWAPLRPSASSKPKSIAIGP